MVNMNQARCNMATLHDLIEPVGYLIRVEVNMNKARCNMAMLHELIEPAGYLVTVDMECESRIKQHGNATQVN